MWIDPSTSQAQTFAHISFCPPHLLRRAWCSNDDARNVTCSTLRRLSAEGPDAPGDGLISFQALERTLTGESDHDPVWPHGYQRSGDLEDISFHSQEPKLSPSCPTSLCTCAPLQAPSEEVLRMEDNRFIFILGGLSGTDTLSLDSHGLPFTHWYSNSNNKPCLLHHIMKV